MWHDFAELDDAALAARRRVLGHRIVTKVATGDERWQFRASRRRALLFPKDGS
jgi:hypothetical protein